MPNNADHIAQLIIKQLNDAITDAEKAELQAWMDASENNQQIAEQFLVDENLLTGIQETFHAGEKIWNRVHETISHQPAKVTRMKPWTKWIAAASIILVVGIASYFVFFNNGVKWRGEKTEVAQTHDVPAPTNTRAVITLADGSKVYLDSAGNGTIAQENNVSVVKNNNGEIVYEGKLTTDHSPLAYNTLFNPRGSKVISLTLSDGTKVWLNSESSLRYPASFVPSAVNREVEITGEAYFEVVHNSKQPFKVHLPNGGVIEDIGTAFNVKAYTDEASIKTTLVEGSVRISAPGSYRDPGLSSGVHPDEGRTVTLKPGEQAVLRQAQDDHSPLTINHSPDLDEVMAWRDGWFHFESADLKTILKEFGRWYDIDVIYEGNISNEKYFTIISRNTSLSDVLKSLQANNIHFRIEGKKLYVVSG
jgi:ferric-dicitrate binding protein FerR (iron transport regulator)